MSGSIEARITKIEQQAPYLPSLDERQDALNREVRGLPANLRDEKVQQFLRRCTLDEKLILAGLPGADPNDPETLRKLLVIAAKAE